MDRAKERKLKGYVERHHIIPRSKGGSDDKSNIVELTAREHLLSHWLLARHTNDHRDWWAFKAMCTLKTDDQNRARPSLRMIAEVRENAHNHPDYIKRNREWNLGRKHTDETKAKMSANWDTPARRAGQKARAAKISKLFKGRIFYDASGSKHMNNGIVSKMVKPEDIEKRLKEGFVFGRLGRE